MLHVLEVETNSPAELAGLVPFKDCLLGTAERAFTDADVLHQELKAHINRLVELYVYNTDRDEVRVVVLGPKKVTWRVIFLRVQSIMCFQRLPESADESCVRCVYRFRCLSSCTLGWLVLTGLGRQGQPRPTGREGGSRQSSRFLLQYLRSVSIVPHACVSVRVNSSRTMSMTLVCVVSYANLACHPQTVLWNTMPALVVRVLIHVSNRYLRVEQTLYLLLFAV
jgi:hypothetical protein